jgi:hypothetical protein
MITRVQTISELKQLFLEIFLNKTSKVSDISDNSVVNATAYGVSKVAQKCLKDIAIVESHIFPDSAYGSYLDSSAKLFGATPRKTTASGSSTYVRLVGNPGTFYPAVTTTFKNYNGITFRLDEEITIDAGGYAYAKVSSIDIGLKSNVDANSIIAITPEPSGHIGVTNEYQATGGYDIEDDETFRQRIRKHLNIVSRSTILYLEEVFRNESYNINLSDSLRRILGDVLKVINLGIGETGMKELAIVMQNGKTLTENELEQMLQIITPYLPITDINRFGTSIGIVLKNVTWQEVDIDFRVQVIEGFDSGVVRKNIQMNLTKYLDFRFWALGKKVEWDDLLQIVKTTEGVRYVPDKFFIPSSDISVFINKLPRIKGFIMRNLEGSIIFERDELIPIFYPI